VFIVILGACAFCCLFKSYRSNQKKLELKHLQSKSQALEYSKVTPTKDSFIDNPHF
jgi:coenzyme F420-reducing hydrogenase gamma subunit